MVDILAICAHPDDLEVCAGGIFLLAKEEGLRTGLLILTDGAASGRANAAQRQKEAQSGAGLLGVDYFAHLAYSDAGLVAGQEQIQAVIPHIRAASPRVILTLHPDDYHPDHTAASRIAEAAAFTARLPQYGVDGSRWQYEALLFFGADPRSNAGRPDLFFDITTVMERKLAACAAHASQNVAGYAEAMSVSHGQMAGVKYAEGLYLRHALRLGKVSSLLREKENAS